MLKDADFGRHLGQAAGLTLTATDATAAAMRQALEAGKGDLDFSVIGGQA